MKLFKRDQKEVIRVQLQKPGVKPIYIPFIECKLDECRNCIMQILADYANEYSIPSDFLFDNKEKVSVCFIDVLTKERRSVNVTGFSIEKIKEIILKFFENGENIYYDRSLQ